MRSRFSASSCAVLAAMAVWGVTAADAQCTHILGSPPPTVNFLLASKIVLVKGAGGSFGDGNDRFKILKGILPTGAPIDPVTADAFHITIRRTDETGPTMLAISLPAGAPWAPVGAASFRYQDPSATLGVRRVLLKSIGADYAHKIVGKNASVLGTPILSGDIIHLMIEIENAGVGYCYGRTLMCTATPGGAACG